MKLTHKAKSKEASNGTIKTETNTVPRESLWNQVTMSSYFQKEPMANLITK